MDPVKKIDYFIQWGYGTRSPVWTKGKGIFMTARFAYGFDEWTHPSNSTYNKDTNPYDPDFKGLYAELDVEFDDFEIIYKAVCAKLRELRDEHNSMLERKESLR